MATVDFSPLQPGQLDKGVDLQRHYPGQGGSTVVIDGGWTDAAGSAGAAAPATSLSISNNSIKDEDGKLHQLTGGHRRMAYVLAYELQALVTKYGLENVGFLTLTFGDRRPPTLFTLQKRFNSLRTNVLVQRYPRSVFVVERGEKNGRLHLHGVVVVGKDIRAGVDFAGIARGVYASAGPDLRSEWSFWRRTAPSYGFGRTEMLPVKSNAEGIARYVGSYLKKHVAQRRAEDKGARLVRFVNYGQTERVASSRLAWANDNGWLWRQKVNAWATVLGMHSMEELSERCGPRWAYLFKDQIMGTRLDAVCPSLRIAMESADATCRREAKLDHVKHLWEREHGTGREYVLQAVDSQQHRQSCRYA